MTKSYKYKNFIFKILFSIGAILLIIESINLMIDPMWYFSGNNIFPENYSYNERFSKTNQYLKSPKSYDCILFGSSKVTLIDPAWVKGYKCYNFAFSAGNIKEFLDYADYINVMGGEIKLVILGVDEDSFIEYPLPRNVPDFILEKNIPSNFLLTYSTYDTLSYSIRTIRKDTLRPRYYREDFVGDILKSANKFYPERSKEYAKRRVGNYYQKNLIYFEQFRKKFPQAKYIGYVPPFNAYLINEMEIAGVLTKYHNLIYQVQVLFDEFYDFTVPSKITSRLDNTYDGLHYNHEANKQVIDKLNGLNTSFGINLKEFTLKEYIKFHSVELNKFRMAKKIM